MFRITFRGISPSVKSNLFGFFLVINFVTIVGFLETIGNRCLSLFEDISSMCCSVIGIVGIVSVVVVVLFFRKKENKQRKILEKSVSAEEMKQK